MQTPNSLERPKFSSQTISALVQSVELEPITKAYQDITQSAPGAFIRLNAEDSKKMLSIAGLSPNTLVNTPSEIRAPNFRMRLDEQGEKLLASITPVSVSGMPFAGKSAFEVSDTGALVMHFEKIQGKHIMGVLSQQDRLDLVQRSGEMLAARENDFNNIQKAEKAMREVRKALADNAKRVLAQQRAQQALNMVLDIEAENKPSLARKLSVA